MFLAASFLRYYEPILNVQQKALEEPKQVFRPQPSELSRNRPFSDAYRWKPTWGLSQDMNEDGPPVASLFQCHCAPPVSNNSVLDKVHKWVLLFVFKRNSY